MTDEILQEISKKLNLLIATSFLPKDKKLTTSEGIEFLLRFGINNGDIAEIIGTTKRTVEVIKSNIGKKQKNENTK